jgi:hypothetical protein
MKQDQQVPQSVAQRIAGWATIAQQYPVFSQTWFYYRMRSFMVPIILLAIAMLAVACFLPVSASAPRIYLAIVCTWVVVVLALVPGRWLAVLVHRQAWSPRNEAIGVVCALLFGMLLAASLTEFTRVDAGKSRLANLVTWLVLLVWWGGIFDLITYFRQRRMMKEGLLLEQMVRYRNERNEVEMRLSVLASQVEPHFLFNTLSGVRAAILTDPQRAVAIVDHLADYLRSTIPQLRADGSELFVKLGSQLDSVQAYLGVIHMRLPRLSFQVDCQADLRGWLIPPLMLISLVENAVKHGIELKKGPAHILVKVERLTKGDADSLAIRVIDDGLGFGEATAGSGIGLSNVRERLQYLYDGKASLELSRVETGGVEACITLPAPTKNGAE